MTGFPFAFATLESAARALASGEVTSAELVDGWLGRIADLDGRLHAFVAVFADAARAAAAAADLQRAAGRCAGPLHGLPVAVKDLFDCAGHPTGAGSRALDAAPAARSATAVRRLEAAGMIVLGKTHTVEFAYGGWGTNPVTGTPWNPWDPAVHRAPGGSSSGSAVAVAAGLAPAALGSDTGGSLRTPAGFCGLVALKTSRGVAGRGGVFPLSPSLDAIGPLTRSVRDAALIVDALQGPDPDDDETRQVPRLDLMSDIERGAGGLRIGRLPDRELAALAPEMRALHDATVDMLERLGARVSEVALPRRVADYLDDAGLMMSAESYARLAAVVDRDDAPVDPVIRARITRGRALSAADYIGLIERRRRDRAAVAGALDRLDAVIAPITQAPAPPVAEIDEDAPPTLYGRVVNFLDLASLALPLGRSADGLPMGMQVIVRKLDDALALRIGRALEHAHGGFDGVPPGL